MKSILVLFFLFGLVGCGSLQERLAKRAGCDPAKVVVTKQMHVPAYSQYDFTCDGKPMVCRDAPFHSSCGPDTPKPAADAKTADAKPADKKDDSKKK